ncbi:MAG: hypothetical protein HYV28_09745 [Ignavibacteriales bacterium]|nr:hypothetical protein [Ignavibacteriales bacterium]
MKSVFFICSFLFFLNAIGFSQPVRSSPFLQVQGGSFIVSNKNFADTYGNSFCWNYAGAVGIKAGSLVTVFGKYAFTTKSYSGPLKAFLYFSNGAPTAIEYKQGNASYDQRNLYLGVAIRIINVQNISVSVMGGLSTVTLKERQTMENISMTTDIKSDGIGGYFAGLSGEYSLPVKRLAITGDIQYDVMPSFEKSIIDMGGLALNLGMRFYLKEIETDGSMLK